jgi:hypothetical protein
MPSRGQDDRSDPHVPVIGRQAFDELVLEQQGCSWNSRGDATQHAIVGSATSTEPDPHPIDRECGNENRIGRGDSLSA